MTIAELRKLCDEEKKPWTDEDYNEAFYSRDWGDKYEREVDAKFRAAARIALPVLLDVLEKQREALEWYAEPEHWTIPYVEGNLGVYDSLARNAIKQTDEMLVKLDGS